MKKGWIVLGSIAVLVLIVFFWFKGTYNGLVVLDENVKNEWAKVQSDYQRRSDLIPNLVSTVQGAAAQEKSIFIGVAEARAKVGQITVTEEVLNNPDAFKKFQQAQDGLGAALSRLLAVSENYPTLKTNENFLGLQAQLEGTENRIKKSRDDFNNVVKDYNIKVREFPTNMLAGMFGFQMKTAFEASAEAQNAPKVDFGTGK